MEPEHQYLLKVPQEIAICSQVENHYIIQDEYPLSIFLPEEKITNLIFYIQFQRTFQEIPRL